MPKRMKNQEYQKPQILVPACEVQVGDLIECLDGEHEVTRVESWPGVSGTITKIQMLVRDREHRTTIRGMQKVRR